MWRRSSRPGGGFTLVEVLVVVASLGMILWMVGSLFFPMQKAAERQRLQVEARQTARGATDYVAMLVRGATDGRHDAGDSVDADNSVMQDDATDGQRVLSAVTTLAHVLGMTVVAEGVETNDQVLALQQSGCDAGQGFLFSAPLDAEAADALITDQALARGLSRQRQR